MGERMMDGCLDERKKNGWMNGTKKEWMDGMKDGWMDGMKDGKKNEEWHPVDEVGHEGGHLEVGEDVTVADEVVKEHQ